jgi:hypothetical protein
MNRPNGMEQREGSALVLERYSVRISAGTRDILTGALSCFRQSLQEDAGILGSLDYVTRASFQIP